MQKVDDFPSSFSNITSEGVQRVGGFLGLNNTQFAEKLGVTGAYLTRVLRHKTPMTDSLRSKVIHLLDEYFEKNPNDEFSKMLCIELLQRMPTDMYKSTLSNAIEYRQLRFRHQNNDN